MGEAVAARELLRDLPDGVAASLVERGDSSRQPPERSAPERYRGVRRTRFLDGRLAAARALGQLGAGDRRVGVGAAGEPLWPAGTVGSISHARGCSVAVAAPTTTCAAIGVDLEDDRVVDGIESYVVDDDEIAWLDGAGPDQRRRRLLAAFSAKEAIYKAFYPRVRRFFDFDAVTLEPAAEGFVARFVSPVDPAYPVGRPLLVGSRWTGGLVASWTAPERD